MDHHYVALYRTYGLSYLDGKISTEKKLLFRISNLKCEIIAFPTLPISKRKIIIFTKSLGLNRVQIKRRTYGVVD
jgi:hypothetical protein